LWKEQAAEQRLRSMLGQLQVLEQTRDKQMKVYQAAHREREMLTDIRKRQKDMYEREWLREEQKRLDDTFMARRHRLS
jgi:flagellar biosynthesis chaperone FliJ